MTYSCALRSTPSGKNLTMYSPKILGMRRKTMARKRKSMRRKKRRSARGKSRRKTRGKSRRRRKHKKTKKGRRRHHTKRRYMRKQPQINAGVKLDGYHLRDVLMGGVETPNTKEAEASIPEAKHLRRLLGHVGFHNLNKKYNIPSRLRIINEISSKDEDGQREYINKLIQQISDELRSVGVDPHPIMHTTPKTPSPMAVDPVIDESFLKAEQESYTDASNQRRDAFLLASQVNEMGKM